VLGIAIKSNTSVLEEYVPQQTLRCQAINIDIFGQKYFFNGKEKFFTIDQLHTSHECLATWAPYPDLTLTKIDQCHGSSLKKFNLLCKAIFQSFECNYNCFEHFIPKKFILNQITKRRRRRRSEHVLRADYSNAKLSE